MVLWRTHALTINTDLHTKSSRYTCRFQGDFMAGQPVSASVESIGVAGLFHNWGGVGAWGQGLAHIETQELEVRDPLHCLISNEQSWVVRYWSSTVHYDHSGFLFTFLSPLSYKQTCCRLFTAPQLWYREVYWDIYCFHSGQIYRNNNK